MAILVDIEMPQNCFQCPMARSNDGGEAATCQVTGKPTNSKVKRLDDCPIVFGNVKVMPAGINPLRAYGFSKRSCGTCSHAGMPEICKHCESYQGLRW